VNYIVGPLLFIILSISIYLKVKHQSSLQDVKQMFDGAVSPNNIALMAILFLLMLVNWGIEARKWQILVNRIEPVIFLLPIKQCCRELHCHYLYRMGLAITPEELLLCTKVTGCDH